MTSIISSAQASATAATSIVVPLGSTPSVGELVLVILSVSNQIVTRGPGYNTTNQWLEAQALRSRADSATLSVWYHTWNAADTGSNATFTFVPAPGLGIGDTSLPNANAQAIGIVLSASAPQEWSQQASAGTTDLSVVLGPQKQSNAGAFTVTAEFLNNAMSVLSTSDGSATLVQSVSTARGSLSAWVSAGSAGYKPRLSSTVAGELLTAFLSVNDSTPNIYTPPVIQEGPMSYDPLGVRYKIARYYTVLNTAGVFTAGRYLSTDQLNAATQVFTNNQPVTSGDRTNLLNSGVGGDFRYSPTGH